MSVQVQAEIGSETIQLESGKWAKQADGSIVYRSGNLVLLATVCATDDSKDVLRWKISRGIF